MLNKKDQKIIRQMMRHIRTFPLLDSEIRQFERDLTGMALEAEKRREDFEEILDMTPTEFCDELLCSIGGRKTPGGRRLLKGAGIYWNGASFFSFLNFPIFDDCDSFGTGIGRGNSSICCNNRSDILWGIFIIWKYRRTQLWRNRKICTARE